MKNRAVRRPERHILTVPGRPRPLAGLERQFVSERSLTVYLRRAVLATICLVLPRSLPAGEVGKLRELDTKALKVEFSKGRITTPKLIASLQELDKAIPGAEAIKKQVDFSKE